MTSNKKSKDYRIIYLCLGFLLIIMGVYLNYEDIIKGEFPDAIMLLGLGINQFLLAYLSPHIFPKDERAKEIIGKSMTINYFILFASILVLFLATGSFGFLTLHATEVLIVLFCIMIIIIPGTMVIYSKII
ncbi:hypothetical protein [Cytobacillus sp. IB215665]|uniref:hypothetical protein n=1 Tax=Cytobacillus sp. IB215665 TaxID=3097357 RepID=UPI002A1523E4|nr:hypothetical protein [Cytobacillus sp. IB215665]MDX8365556.1 hypothetical protein [Cytobacillus sp. IB215665]